MPAYRAARVSRPRVGVSVRAPSARLLPRFAHASPGAARSPHSLGEYLVEQKIKPNELVASWAKRGEEPISKMEFRQHVRKLPLDGKVESKDIDALFEELDDDGAPPCLES